MSTLWRLTSSRCKDVNISTAPDVIFCEDGNSVQSKVVKAIERELLIRYSLLFAAPFSLGDVDAVRNDERHWQAAILARTPGESERRIRVADNLQVVRRIRVTLCDRI